MTSKSEQNTHMKKYTYLFYFLLFLNASNSQTFSGTTGIILDNGQNNDFIVNVTGLSSTTLNNALGLVEVCMNISHSYDSDLNVFLIAPDGTTINLFSGIGADGDNFSTTCLNQTAPTSINTASPPFNGTFKPQETLGNINNQQFGNLEFEIPIHKMKAPLTAGTSLLQTMPKPHLCLPPPTYLS